MEKNIVCGEGGGLAEQPLNVIHGLRPTNVKRKVEGSKGDQFCFPGEAQFLNTLKFNRRRVGLRAS